MSIPFRGIGAGMLVGLITLGGAPPIAAQGADDPAPEPRCEDHTPQRRAYFGDLHVHTAFSVDAWGFGTRGEPVDAYRAAATTLDFTAVTDHAE